MHLKISINFVDWPQFASFDQISNTFVNKKRELQGEIFSQLNNQYRRVYDPSSALSFNGKQEKQAWHV
ncbi:hypothetical protein QWZ16_14940 [Vibrio ostreicida]|uniref:Uncharacterized protein n=1 Tax=Vibrio ostreicida TaxID=526588 RepID=A0ABT8BY18_9VIBR|nr:hypothetical protein [Vibrio ostreicida]MDN3610289.1 hypothetical protein [Vibrio ostreicida]MDN3610987.1 hypothetical protein [Vibrio ostreicida]